MRFILERIAAPEVEPVSVAEFVRNAGEFTEAGTERADDIERCLQSAREWAEAETGRALIDQTWRLTLTDDLGTTYDPVTTPPPCGYFTGSWRARAGEILLRRSPALSVISFKSMDAAGDETDVDAATYELRDQNTKWPRIVGLNGAAWIAGTFRITFRAGYADRDVSPAEDGAEVPAVFRSAILLYAQALYDHEDAQADALKTAAERLLRYERCNLDFA